MNSINYSPQTINWNQLKGDYHQWRSTLWEKTIETLGEMSRNQVSMDALNVMGVFHKISKGSEEMKEEYSRTSTVPHQWISKGVWPAIWCSLFDKNNTYSLNCGPLRIVRFSFKPDFKIFNFDFEEHQKMWDAWQSVSENLAKPNLWAEDKNYRGDSMKDRVSYLNWNNPGKFPDHLAFFKENAFGAALGIQDYASLVILQEEAIENVEFLY